MSPIETTEDKTMTSSTTATSKFTHRLYTGELAYEFVGRRKLWYTISGVLVAIAVLALLVRGLSLGIEFKGGAN
ncbi:MAG: protein translocase subunit SecF, partial [Propionibacteriaceae bacterium]